jgi:hypothetical protein
VRLLGARQPLGRRLGRFRTAISVGVRWAASFSAWATLGVVVVAWIEGDAPLLEHLLRIPAGFAVFFPGLFGCWLLTRALSTVDVHEAGLVAGSTFGSRVSIRWDEVESVTIVSMYGLSLIELHRHGKLNGFIPVEVFSSAEFRRLVSTTAATESPIFGPDFGLS